MLGTCFIFIKYWREEGCLSLALTPQGEIAAPLQERNFEEIKQMQQQAKTLVVLSAEQASLHQVQLPWLPDKKARLAIPFALEEHLADNLDDLHFAFDRKHYFQGHYLVVVCKHALLNELMRNLEKQQITFDSLTLDWWALENNEACVTDTSVLFHNKLVFCGSLPADLALPYLNEMLDDQTLYTFSDSANLVISRPALQVAMESQLWIAKRLHGGQPMNLCQGSLQQGSSDGATKRWYSLALGLSLLCLLVFFLTNVAALYSIKKETRSVDDKIAATYRVFFPKAQQIISPRFRISQLLRSQKVDEDKSFWIMLNQLSLGMKQYSAQIESVQFQKNVLKVKVLSKDFASLESLQTFLKKAAIQVKQSEAASRNDQVSGSLELSL